ncbi:septation protein SepH [Euzebya sp.]|uniref:septation protein SepH n=1 Tax=Euzebya sp. TaxID=1971409 RepID=UPI0035163E82
MQPLELVGYTADLSALVLARPDTGERFRVPVSSGLVATLVELLETTGDDDRRALLDGVLDGGDGRGPAPDAPSVAAALVALGRVAAAPPPAPPPVADSERSRLTPSEIQRMLRAGKPPETVADQAGVSLDWVLRWNQPIAAEQRKVITSVRGGRQERPGFGMSDDLIGDAVRTNLLERDVDADDESVQWTAARPEGRPYWTVTLRYADGDGTRRATWRYDIGTGRVTPRDDLALELGWTTPVTHPSPGRLHHGQPEDDPPPPPRAAPTPPPARPPLRWEPPTPPASRRA